MVCLLRRAHCRFGRGSLSPSRVNPAWTVVTDRGDMVRQPGERDLVDPPPALLLPKRPGRLSMMKNCFKQSLRKLPILVIHVVTGLQILPVPCWFGNS